MNVELINTGTELMLGRVLNTHQQWICHRLADLGYTVARQVAVPDTGHDIEQTVREALSRADLVITTGGLGPTSDDITRDLIAKLLGRKLHEDAAIVKHIESFFKARNRPMPASTRVQALVPEGAIVLHNPNGTAPGLGMRIEDRGSRIEDGKAAPTPSSILHPPSSTPKWLVMLPGPPRELRPMFNDTVVPLLQRELPLTEPFVCLTLRTTGIGESVVEEKIGAQLKPLVERGLDLGYCARVGQVDVRLAARGQRGTELIREGEVIVRAAVGSHIFSSNEEDIESVIVQLLTAHKQTLAIAESCTGGNITHRITNVPGASAVLLAGLVTYANEAKEKFLGVRRTTLDAHGAVSEATAREMADGARRETGADFAISVTGIAGPSGGTTSKPAGTAFIGFASAMETLAVKVFNPYDRETFKQATSQQALELLRRKVLAAG
ncbi:MAG: nicotinamide-nucleotide amidohydrolase family protein [Verrucomicrobia bacterium]|nr:nicotinamide-nucleotide amidohydrolase family protein [Verrucomicrobiota bacterium]